MTWNINPILLSLGPVDIYYYGLFFALGLFLAYNLVKSMAKHRGISVEKIDTLIIYVVIGLILGARFGHILFYNFDYYLSNPLQILQIWNGGLASHGGALGAFTGFALFTWRERRLNPKQTIDFWTYTDLLAIASSFMIIFVRLGNFFNSEIVGRPTDAPWGIIFPRVDELARHPSQLYEMFIGILLLISLYPLWIKRNQHYKAGFFFGLFLTLYFSLRFIAEFYKDLAINDWVWGLTTGQLLSLPFALFGLGMMISKGQKKQ